MNNYCFTGTRTRKQGEYFTDKKKDPRDSSIILFPGQGSQYVGMCKDLLRFPMVKDLFELANYILKYDLLRICLKGPTDKLDKTKYVCSFVEANIILSVLKGIHSWQLWYPL